MSRKAKKVEKVEEDVKDRYDSTYLKNVKHEGMDEITYNDIKSAFAFVDQDKSGTLEISELKKELKACKEEVSKMYPDLNVDEVIDMIVTRCDANGDGHISFAEMIDVFKSEVIYDLTKKENTDKIYEEFAGPGKKIDKKCLEKVAKELGEKPEDVERMMFYADVDEDKVVDEDEFYNFLNMSEEDLLAQGFVEADSNGNVIEDDSVSFDE